LRADGWVVGVDRRPSPNFDHRPDGAAVTLVVVHAISLPPGVFGGDYIVDFFQNRLDPRAHPYFAGIAAMRVSAHFLIRRDGTLLQFVSCHERAWHAGESCWRGVERCNDFSLGIELEGCDDQPFDARQYGALRRLIRLLRRSFPVDAVVGHSAIAPGRKTDPGPCFDWSEIDETKVRARPS
jgi:AmpD protein